MEFGQSQRTGKLIMLALESRLTAKGVIMYKSLENPSFKKKDENFTCIEDKFKTWR
jgi:hypothetical protein